jgi:hypothetical protein
MGLRRTSWTTKPDRALVCETIEKANQIARMLLGPRRALDCHFLYVSRQGGYVIHNEPGTKMLADG